MEGKRINQATRTSTQLVWYSEGSIRNGISSSFSLATATDSITSHPERVFLRIDNSVISSESENGMWIRFPLSFAFLDFTLLNELERRRQRLYLYASFVVPPTDQEHKKKTKQQDGHFCSVYSSTTWASLSYLGSFFVIEQNSTKKVSDYCVYGSLFSRSLSLSPSLLTARVRLNERVT